MNHIRKFQRTKEDFECEHCGYSVVGTGYTNHCPQCLYSKHVDVNPGDRDDDCGGLMKPVWIEFERGAYVLTHRCEKCGFKRRNKVQDIDNPESVINFAKQCASKPL